MAAPFFKFDRNTNLGRDIDRWLELSREATLKGEAVRAQLIQMRDSDGSQDAHYQLIQSEGGFQSAQWESPTKAAHESFLELDSMYAAQQSAKAAVMQACAKHGA